MNMKTRLVLGLLALTVSGIAQAGAHCRNGIPAVNPSSIYEVGEIQGTATVTDKRTGLIWQKCLVGQEGTDCTGDAITMSWAEALEHAQSNAYDGWRLPNRQELLSLVDECAFDPALNTEIFRGNSGGEVWTSTPFVSFDYGLDTTYAWAVWFYRGSSDWRSGATRFFVRLVRGGDDYVMQEVSGQCGTASGQPAAAPPADNLCVSGQPGQVIPGTDGYTWQCLGHYETASCAAPFAVEEGTCGSAANTPSLLMPAANLCDAGTAEGFDSAQGRHSWQCAGNTGQPAAACSVAGANVAGETSMTLELLNSNDCTLNSAKRIEAPGGPAGFNMPYGLVDFTAQCPSGGTAQLRATFSEAVGHANNGYWKYLENTNEWLEMPALLDGHSVTFSVQDNSEFDLNSADGVIRDPSGVGVLAFGAGVNPVPTLSQWSLALMTALMGLFGLGQLRRQWRH